MINRMTARHKAVADKDEALRKRMCELAEQRKSFGSPRLHVLLKQEGLVVNHKRTERIYREEKLSLRKHKKKHQATSSRKPDDPVDGPLQCLAMDFVHDNLADGRSIRILSMIDLWDRSCPVLAVSFSQTGQRVVNVLNLLMKQGRMPRTLRTDNGPEFTSNALKIWAEKNGISINYTRPGKPTDNGHIESFNGRLREECLNQHIFTSLADAQEKIELWRQDYNQARPHSSLGWLSPAAYREKNINQYPEPNLLLA